MRHFLPLWIKILGEYELPKLFTFAVKMLYKGEIGDDSLSLNTRSLKYRKLGQGLLVIEKEQKTHFHLLGNNYIYETLGEEETSGGFAQNLEVV